MLSRIENIHDELKKQVDIFYQMVYASSMYTRGEEGISHRKIVMDVIEDYKANEEELLQLYKEFSEAVETKRYRQALAILRVPLCVLTRTWIKLPFKAET